MTAAPKLENRRYTVEEYFALLPTLVGRWEYVEGRIVEASSGYIDPAMMAGASRRHALVSVNLAAAVHSALRESPCRAYSNELLIRIPDRSRYRLADLTIACDSSATQDNDDDLSAAESNPTVLFEILSVSSEGDDRGKKFDEYRRIPSLREYVLVAQEKPVIQIFRRDAAGAWSTFAFAEGLDATLELKSVGVKISLQDVYSKVVFPRPTDWEGDDSPSL